MKRKIDAAQNSVNSVNISLFNVKVSKLHNLIIYFKLVNYTHLQFTRSTQFCTESYFLFKIQSDDTIGSINPENAKRQRTTALEPFIVL